MLYVLTDKQSSSFLDYSRSSGLNVSKVFDNIDDLRVATLTQFDDARIVVIDTGSGRFITPTIRKSIIDLLGMKDENMKFTVFYTDSVLKSDAISSIGKDSNIGYIEYVSSMVCVATLLSYNEDFILSGNADTSSKLVDRKHMLSFVGAKTPGVELEKVGKLSINPFALANQVVDTEDASIVGYNIEF